MKTQMSVPARRLMIASLVAAATMMIVMWMFAADRRVDAAPLKTVPVLVTKTYIAAQSPLEPGCCYEKRIPELYAPPRPLLKKDVTPSRFHARGDILKGEILTASRVSDAATAASVGWDIAENETAVTVHLTPEAAMAGVLAPGDTVNVLVTFDKRCCVLVADARVLVVGKRAGRGADEMSAASDDTLVTLKLESKDALRTVLASRKQTLSLALVSPLNTREAPSCVTLGDL